jgi:hypothetical protein
MFDTLYLNVIDTYCITKTKCVEFFFSYNNGIVKCNYGKLKILIICDVGGYEFIM